MNEVCISIISPSGLLRESLFHLMQTGFQNQAFRSLQSWVFLDYGVGRDRVIAGIQDVRLRYPAHYLIVMELPDDLDVMLDCIAAGAHAYALQDTSSGQMIETIRQVDRGLFQCPIEMTTRLAQHLTQPIKHSRPACLTQREWEVLSWIVQGESDRAIAEGLCIAVRTVKHHVHNLLGKLQVQSRWQAAQLAQENDWLENDRSKIDRPDRS